jgi:hypothetical protein
MGLIVIACYRAKEGKEPAFRALLDDHVPTLRTAGLLTARPAVLVRSGDGSYVEVFEWKDVAAKDAAHSSAVVGAVWSRFAELCDIRSLGDLPEADYPFATFERVEAS